MLTSHIYGWDVDKKREIFTLVQRIYAKKWMKFTQNKIKARQLAVLEAAGTRINKLRSLSELEQQRVQAATGHLPDLSEKTKLRLFMSHRTCAKKWIQFHRNKLQTRLEVTAHITLSNSEVDSVQGVESTCDSMLAVNDDFVEFDIEPVFNDPEVNHVVSSRFLQHADNAGADSEEGVTEPTNTIISRNSGLPIA